MPKFQMNFSGRKKDAIGVFENFWETVEASDFETAKLKLYGTYEHVAMIRCAELTTRYAITHVNADGMRTLTFANHGRNHSLTREIAEEELRLLAPSVRKDFLHDMADSLEVRPVDCYDHGDAVGVYFDEQKANQRATLAEAARKEAEERFKSLLSELWEGVRVNGLYAPAHGREGERLIHAYCGAIAKQKLREEGLQEQLAAANKRANAAEHDRDVLRAVVNAPQEFVILRAQYVEKLIKALGKVA